MIRGISCPIGYSYPAINISNKIERSQKIWGCNILHRRKSCDGFSLLELWHVTVLTDTYKNFKKKIKILKKIKTLIQQSSCHNINKVAVLKLKLFYYVSATNTLNSNTFTYFIYCLLFIIYYTQWWFSFCISILTVNCNTNWR